MNRAKVSQHSDTRIHISPTSSDLHISALSSQTIRKLIVTPTHHPRCRLTSHDHHLGRPSHHGRRRSNLYEQVRAARAHPTPSASPSANQLQTTLTPDPFTPMGPSSAWEAATWCLGYMVYATNGAGPKPLPDQTLRDTAQNVSGWLRP